MYVQQQPTEEKKSEESNQQPIEGENKKEPATGEEINAENAEDILLKDFQNTLKEVLQDESGTEQTMQQMQQIMQLIGKSMNGMEGMDIATGENTASEPNNTATTNSATTPAQPS